MAKYKQKISTELLYTMSCFHDPAVFFEYFNSKERTKENKPYSLLQPFLDYSFSRLLGRYRCISGSRNVSKTTLIENETLQDLLTKPDQKTGFVIPSEKHMVEVADNMVKKVEKYPILETIFKNWSVKNRVMEFHTGHILEFRIMGTDTTGEKTGVSLHTGKILIDESQLVPKEYLQQLTPGAMKGFEYLITGVSNNLRTTALWYGVSDPMFIYIRYAMYEGPNWDEDMKKMMMEQTGGESTEGWKTLVEGRWGDRAYNVFPNNKIWEAMRAFELHKFPFIKQTYHDLDFESIKLRLTLPVKDKKFIFFILGVDVGGNSQNSPSEFTVWGCYMNGEKKAYAIVYKLSLFNIGTVIQAEVFDYLAQYFSFFSVGIDAQAVGSDLYRNITEGKILPADRTEIYKSICKPFIMTATIVVDEIYNKQKEKFEDLKMPVKIKATTLVQDLFRENLMEIPNDSELIEAFQAETWQSNRQRIGGITYMNDKNEHFVDSTRMAILSVWQTEKDGEQKSDEKISRDIPGPNIRRLK